MMKLGLVAFGFFVYLSSAMTAESGKQEAVSEYFFTGTEEDFPRNLYVHWNGNQFKAMKVTRLDLSTKTIICGKTILKASCEPNKTSQVLA